MRRALDNVDDLSRGSVEDQGFGAAIVRIAKRDLDLRAIVEGNKQALAVSKLRLANHSRYPLAQSIAQRQVNQNARIRQGVQSGSLTAGETARLRAQQAHLHRQVVRNRADGGGLTAAERARIQANANQNSRQITRLKNNNR